MRIKFIASYYSYRFICYLLLTVSLSSCSFRTAIKAPLPYNTSGFDAVKIEAYQRIHDFLTKSIREEDPLRLHSATKIDTIFTSPIDKKLYVKFNAPFGYRPLREADIAAIYDACRKRLQYVYPGYQLSIYGDGYPIEQLVPNYFRSDSANYDRKRMPVADKRGKPITRNVNKPFQPASGLFNRNIALWHSHGWYYEHKSQRWEWQRARVFQTVEDLLPGAFVLPYLVPMLENAGANVFLPRERDLQSNEAIVDNDSASSGQYQEFASSEIHQWQTGDSGFAIGSLPYTEGINPFQLGTTREVRADSIASAKAIWFPVIPADGKYAVYIAYAAGPDRADDAEYIVRHSGGHTTFHVNQQIGGSTWIYLGSFHFQQGAGVDSASVELNNRSKRTGAIISADAVRFGGGMGNVARNGSTSERPRFMEGARYYLQFAGMPDSLVYNVTNKPENDYIDDYRSRGEWVNFLRGAPFGPNRDRDAAGLNIPIDLSLAFHTDAGRTSNDTTIGTLMIYTIDDAKGEDVFPDQMSRLSNRDLGDIMQTQIVDDLRRTYDPAWNRRNLWNRPYSESFRPNVPAILLELLSHHNFLDMKFALDPRFRFDASRSIYKGMLKFLASQHQKEYTVQPLPVSHFRTEFYGENSVRLRWQAVADSLEPSAIPDRYIVYSRREGGGGFDNGVLTELPELIIPNLAPGEIYSFKVTAVNDGGESFPSEILSVCRLANEKAPVLIVNGFDRVAPPATLESETMKGFADFWDQGVADRYDMNYIGSQFGFATVSPWTNDEAPGHGASHANFETRILPGNTHDFPHVHGLAIRAAGYSFISSSDEAVMDSLIPLQPYPLVDLILGEEKETDWPKPVREKQFEAFPARLQERIRAYCQAGGNMLISGAYVGSDLFRKKKPRRNSADPPHPDVLFGIEILKMSQLTNHADKSGQVQSIDSVFFPQEEILQYNTGYHPEIYTVEAPDALMPIGEYARTIGRYKESNMSAGIAYDGTYRLVILGFPFETIISADQRQRLMTNICRFLLSEED